MNFATLQYDKASKLMMDTILNVDDD